MAFAKKGQEGLTLTTLLLIVLGIVVVVVVIIGFTTGFDFIFGKVEQLPGQSLQAAVEACKIAADNDLRADYCNVFREVEINGLAQYVICDTTSIESNYPAEASKFDCFPPSTTSQPTDINIKEFCQNQKLKKDTLVAGKKCESVGAVLA